MLHTLLFGTGHGMGANKRHAGFLQHGAHGLVNPPLHGTHIRYQYSRFQ